MAAPNAQTMIVAGAGIIGLTLALALKQSLGDALEVVVADPSDAPARRTHRATAIAAGPRRMFETLGVWRRVADQAQPIAKMEISDSRLGDAVRPVYLRFDGEVEPGEPFAHMVEDDDLAAPLTDMCRAAGVEFVSESVEGVSALAASLNVMLSSGRARRAALLAGADGARSRLRAHMRLQGVGRDYPLAGIVAALAHDQPHEGRATQHFLPHGPLALLPLRGDRSSIVWTTSRDEARRLLALAPNAFVEELQAAAGWERGALRLLDPPRSFPLSLHVSRRFVAERFALVGDAAHAIHPLAGQGLNLGLRDVAALAEEICDQARLGLDIGDPAMLDRYQRARRFDTMAMATATDALDSLFRAQATPIRMLRDLGMGLVDRAPAVKAGLMREAAALGSGAGRLFRGEMP